MGSRPRRRPSRSRSPRRGEQPEPQRPQPSGRGKPGEPRKDQASASPPRGGRRGERPDERPRRKRNLSKFLSLILRHRPDEFGLKPDEKGFVSFVDLLNAVRKTPGWKWVRREDVLSIVEGSDKKRFEIDQGSIRAIYGHSIQTEIELEEIDPPDILYHGTSLSSAREMLEKGLVPHGRQYIHLCDEKEEAIRIAFRRGTEPALIVVRARDAKEAGHAFFRGSDGAYLTQDIPTEYCSFDESGSRREIEEYHLHEWMDKVLNSRVYSEQEEAMEELFSTMTDYDRLQQLFMDATHEEDVVRRANAASALLPTRRESVERLLEMAEDETNLVVLRNVVIALDLLPVREKFGAFQTRIARALARLASLDDEYLRFRAQEALVHLGPRERTFEPPLFLRRPDMTARDVARELDRSIRPDEPQNALVTELQEMAESHQPESNDMDHSSSSEENDYFDKENPL